MKNDRATTFFVEQWGESDLVLSTKLVRMLGA